MKIIFFGSQDFSLKFLKFFLECDDIEIIAVFTREPKPAGRGKRILKTKVHEFIEMNHKEIPVLTPKTLKNVDFQDFLKNSGIKIGYDMNFVVGYGLILPKSIIEFPKYGTLNVHPSDLPLYRGAAPIERTLMNGEKETKSILMYMDEGLDTGDIIDSEEIDVEINDNFESLSQKIFEKAKIQILKVFSNLKFFLENRRKQSIDSREPTYAHKISNSEQIVDFCQFDENQDFNVLKIHNKIRGLNHIGVSFILKNLNFKIKVFEAVFEYKEVKKEGIGSFIIENKVFKIISNNGFIVPLKIQKEGGRIISNRDFVNGLKVYN